MSYNIEFPNNNFDFSKITLANPVILQQQSYFSKIMSNNNELMVQMPKCTSKQGFVNSSKRYYCDLMFPSENTELLSWFEKLEEKIQKLIYSQRKNWFHEDVEPDDIENIFTSSLRSFKSGKFFLCRTMLNSPRMLQTTKLNIFDENENSLEMSSVDDKTEFISILHIHGIKFSSRNFQIYVEMKQMMVINSNPVFTKCLIQAGGNIASEDNKVNNEVPSLETNEHENEKESVKEENEKIEEPLEVVETEKLEDLEIKDITNDFIIQDNSDNNSDNTIEEKYSTEVNEIKEVVIENDNVEKQNQLEEPTITLDDHREQLKNQQPLEINERLPNELQEIQLSVDNLETIQLKNKQELYLQEYKTAREKAKKARITALKALLKAKNIKDKYLIDTMELSDEEYEDDNTTIHTSDLESNADSLESFSDDGNENEEGESEGI